MLTTLRLGGQCSGDNYESGTLIVIGKIRSVKHLSYSPSPPRRPATPWSYMASQHLYGQVPSVWSQVCPKIFNAVVDFLAWTLFCNGIQFVLHYLDDFLVIFPPGSALAAGMRSQVEAIFDYARLQEILSCWRDRKRCTKDLQILLGHLSHAAIVIRPGRIFLRTLFSLLSRLADPCHYTRLNLEARTDIAWWQCLLLHWNGPSFLSPSRPFIPPLLKRFRVIWLWSVQPRAVIMVQTTMASVMGCSWHKGKRTCTHCCCSSHLGPALVRLSCMFSL